MVEQFNRKLILETGEEYYGYGFGAKEDRVFEIVFNTSMVGYQEIISDPSYAGQAVVMTYPLIGNYGIADDDYESRTMGLSALIVREYNDQPSNFRYTKTLGEVLDENHIPGIYGLDTRELTRFLRDHGTCRALLCNASVSVEEGKRIINETAVAENLVAQVSCKKRWYSRTSNHAFNVVAIDCGTRLSFIHALNDRGCNVTVVPYNTSAETIAQLNPDGILISNGPGDPHAVPETVETIRTLRGKYPMFGIGMGNLLLALACDVTVEKLKFGHHGANYPVRCVATGDLEITGQNHGFTVNAESAKAAGLTVTHVNIMDGSVEGIASETDKLFGVQFHPDNADGPHGRINIFDQFINMMKEAQING